MSFGQPMGPPADGQQLRTLERLITDLGYDSYRAARGPLRLTQRQAGGRFTRTEADELIERLESEAEAEELARSMEAIVDEAAGSATAGDGPSLDGLAPRSGRAVPATPAEPTDAAWARPTSRPVARVSADERRARELPSEVLAAELQRRGWAVVAP